VKISTLTDANVLIDALGAEKFPWRRWSLAALKQSFEDGVIVFSAVVWAELSTPAIPDAVLTRAFAWLRPQHEDFPYAAAHTAGVAHRLYRQRGGTGERTLPDFLIGAHAQIGGHRLLTRDANRYRAYFPKLEIIAPDTHPMTGNTG
jgi:predicted nucleic acid-binding protein